MKKYNVDDFTWLAPVSTNGQNMVNARINAGLSQLELAEKVGVKVRQVQRWENETSKPSPNTLRKLDIIFDKDWKK